MPGVREVSWLGPAMSSHGVIASKTGVIPREFVWPSHMSSDLMIDKLRAELAWALCFTICVWSWSGPYGLQYACRASLDLMLYNMRVELVWTLRWSMEYCLQAPPGS